MIRGWRQPQHSRAQTPPNVHKPFHLRSTLTSFPALSQSDFAHACQSLHDRYRAGTHPSRWISVNYQSDALYIRVAYPFDNGEALRTVPQRPEVSTPFVEAEIVEEDEVRS